MPIFKSNPVTIEAIQFTGTNIVEIMNFVGLSANEIYEDCIFINTLEGTMKASVNDFIIKGTKGELYPCKPDVFEVKYSPA